MIYVFLETLPFDRDKYCVLRLVLGCAGYWHTPAPVRYFIRAPNLIGFQATWLQDRPFGDSAWRGERFITKKNDFFEKKTCAHNSARV